MSEPSILVDCVAYVFDHQQTVNNMQGISWDYSLEGRYFNNGQTLEEAIYVSGIGFGKMTEALWVSGLAQMQRIRRNKK